MNEKKNSVANPATLVTLTTELHLSLDARAKKECRSRASLLRYLVEQGLEHERENAQAALQRVAG